eukprot:1123002-Prymnesium_polylepis.1
MSDHDPSFVHLPAVLDCALLGAASFACARSLAPPLSRYTAMRLSLIALTLAARGARSVSTATRASGRVRLAGGKARLFKGGNPIVYGGAVGAVDGDPQPGAVVDVVDGAGGLIGWGVFNPHSMYRVRLLATDEESLLGHRDVTELLRHRLTAAVQLRAACGLPCESTTAYRLVNSEGDRISGLTVDMFGSTAVAVTSALWLEQRRDEVVAVLQSLPGVDEVVWRRSDGRLQQDGWEKAKADDGQEHHAAAPPPPAPQVGNVEVYESGLRFLVSPALGQKSGFYCDQRDNRRLLAEVCAGKAVLDLFCYSGGFSISAGAAGAASCLGIDSSAGAIEMARRNAALNGLDGVCDFVQADVHKFVSGRDDAGAPDAAGYDVVICDPPKLAPSVKDLPRATRKYRTLNRGAMRAVKRGGLLLSCSCSAAMTQGGGFIKVLQEAALAEGRSLTVLRVSGAAPDHVINPGCPESAYLTVVLAHVA